MRSDRNLTIPTRFHSTRLCSIHGCRITSGEDERLKKERSLKRLTESCDWVTCSVILLMECWLYSAHVLTLLPGRVFQVFQVVREEEERENREFIDYLFTSIISVNIYFNASTPSKHKQYLIISSWFPMSDDLTWPDYKLGSHLRKESGPGQ